jgi:aspartyl-tRNA(Asn)/glutamyl-tRNA(Gln) amidotransferase subunit A
MAGEEPQPLEPVSLNNLRFGIIQGAPLSGLDSTVSERFGQALTVLGRSGCLLSDEKFAPVDEVARNQSDLASSGRNVAGSLLFAEAFAIHEGGRAMSSADLIRTQRARARLVAAMDLVTQQFDALIMPTTKIVAPLLSESTTPEGFAAKSPLLAGNTSLVNFLDLCAISLRMPRARGLPVGPMLVARNGHDRRLLQVASGVERLFAA